MNSLVSSLQLQAVDSDSELNVSKEYFHDSPTLIAQIGSGCLATRIAAPPTDLLWSRGAPG